MNIDLMRLGYGKSSCSQQYYKVLIATLFNDIVW